MDEGIRDEGTRDEGIRDGHSRDEGTETPPPRRSSARWMVGAAIVAGAGVGVAAILGTNGASRNQESAACPGSAAIAARMDPLAKGQVAALNVSTAPQPLPPISFRKADGTSLSLADFKGRTVLLNLWATWCV